MNRLKQVNPKLAHELINQGIEGISKADYETAKLLKPGSGWVPSGGAPGVPRGCPGPKGGSPAPVPVPVQQITPPLYPPPRGATEGAVENGNNPSTPSQKTGGEPEVTPDNVAPDKPGPPPCPHEQIVEAYHELLPECPRVREWGAPNRKQLAARWREKKERQNLEWWRRVFQHVSESDFLMGRISRDGPFVFSLGWFVKASNFAKVLNGQYENRMGNGAGCAGQQVRRTANQQYMHELGEFLEAIDEVDEGRCRSGIGTTPAALSGGRT